MTEHEKAGCAIGAFLFTVAFVVVNLLAIIFTFWGWVFR
jgi:hypothetical protein